MFYLKNHLLQSQGLIFLDSPQDLLLELVSILLGLFLQRHPLPLVLPGDGPAESVDVDREEGVVGSLLSLLRK